MENFIFFFAFIVYVCIGGRIVASERIMPIKILLSLSVGLLLVLAAGSILAWKPSLQLAVGLTPPAVFNWLAAVVFIILLVLTVFGFFFLRNFQQEEAEDEMPDGILDNHRQENGYPVSSI